MADKDTSFSEKTSFVPRQESSYGWSDDGDADDGKKGTDTGSSFGWSSDNDSDDSPGGSSGSIAFGNS